MNKLCFVGSNVEEDDVLEELRKLWKANVPRKFHMFEQRLLLNKLPLRVVLARIGVTEGSQIHLFLFCIVVSQVWYKNFFGLSLIQNK